MAPSVSPLPLSPLAHSWQSPCLTRASLLLFRGKHDLLNAVGGGAFTGMAMAWRSGPGAMAGGAFFIGAFSFAIDYYMESYSWEEVKKLTW